MEALAKKDPFSTEDIKDLKEENSILLPSKSYFNFFVAFHVVTFALFFGSHITFINTL